VVERLVLLGVVANAQAVPVEHLAGVGRPEPDKQPQQGRPG